MAHRPRLLIQRATQEESPVLRHPVLLDRDGVLNKNPGRGKYVRSWAEWEWLPGAKEALRLLKDFGHQAIVISNQAGIALGELTEQDLSDIHRHMTADVLKAGGQIAAIYYCPHGREDGCQCRKPRPGMLHQAQRDFNLDLSRTWFIGDDERDGQAAEAAGCRWARVSEDCSLLDVAQRLVHGELRVASVSKD
jgi:histidinol-phosphate phosphatase family protein